MKNIHSPYQASLWGLITTTYCKADLQIIQDKIKKANNSPYIVDSFREQYIEEQKKNFEFICRQLNQQMLENA